MNLLPGRWLLGAAFAISLASAADCQTGRPAFKGWELYSWLDGTEWRFSLHLGTNRYKFCDEIRNRKGALSLDQVEGELGVLAPGESLFWEGPGFAGGSKIGNCGVAYPPREIIARVRDISDRLGLRLEMIEAR
jgi:hypothetical protein